MQRRGIDGGGARAVSGRASAPISGRAGLIDRKPAFMTREAMISLLEQKGYRLSQFLLAQMKIPDFVLHGERELEFFDTRTKKRPQSPSGPQDPIFCIDQKMEPPQWLGNWYMAITGEPGKGAIAFFYRQKGVFGKFPMADAESALPEKMRLRTVSGGSDWNSPR